MSGSSSDDDPFDQALRWQLQLDDAPMDAALQRGFRTWLGLSPARHAAAMAQARALLAAAQGPAAAVGEALAIDGIPPATDPGSDWQARPAIGRRPARRRWQHAALAASVALLAVAGAWLGTGGLDGLRSDARTGVGEVRRIALTDGSTVTLNTDSAVALALDGNARSVRLLRGEAYFQVTHDAGRPFVVHSAGGSARVLGTAFNVRLDGDGTQVSVVEGRVSVTPAQGGAATVLGAGQRAWLAGGRVQRAPMRDPLEATAWRQRRLVYYNAPLAQVAHDLSRYRRGAIWVRGDATRRLPVSGAFAVTGPDAGLRTVLDTLQLEAVELPGLTVVYRSGSEAPAGPTRR